MGCFKFCNMVKLLKQVRSKMNQFQLTLRWLCYRMSTLTIQEVHTPSTQKKMSWNKNNNGRNGNYEAMWNTGANRLSNGWVPNVPRAKMFAIRRTPRQCVHRRMCWSVVTISPITSLHLPTPPVKNTHQFHYKMCSSCWRMSLESGLKGLWGFSIRSIRCPTSGSSSSKWSSCKDNFTRHTQKAPNCLIRARNQWIYWL